MYGQKAEYPLPVWTYIGPTWDCNVSVTSVTAHLSATLTGHDGEAYIYHISRAQVGLISGLSRCECVIHSKNLATMHPWTRIETFRQPPSDP